MHADDPKPTIEWGADVVKEFFDADGKSLGFFAVTLRIYMVNLMMRMVVMVLFCITFYTKMGILRI